MKLSRTLLAAVASGTLVLGLALLPSPAHAETSAEIQERVNEAYAQLQEYTKELELANGELATVTEELEQTRAQIEQTQAEIEQKEQDIEEGQQAISERLSDTYKHGGTSLIDVVLGSSDFDELFSNLFYANCIADHDAELVEQVKSDRDELEQKQEELAEQEQTQSELVAEQQARVDEVNQRVSEQQSYYEALDQDLKDKLAEEEAVRAAEEAAREEEESQGGGSASDNGNTDSGNAPSSVVDVALAQVGKPYVWGAGGPNSFDCSGLTSYAYAQVGVSIPHQSQQQYNLVAGKGHIVYDISNLKPGDLVFWGNGGSSSSIYHVGLYIGGGQYVHASSPGVGVIVSTLSMGGNYVGGGSPV